MKKNLKTVLVAGGAGFIGSHLCDFLINKDYKVICVDNLITGRKENIHHLKGKENFLFVEKDIRKPLKIREKVDYIYHLASPASPKDYLNNPLFTLETGAMGTLNILKLAQEKDARILYASTSEVYGDPDVNPQPESYWGNVNPIGPRSVYDESKRYAESLVMAYHRKYNIETRIARIFNTYGPRMKIDDGRVVSNFLSQALNNEPLTVYGDGKQTRSLCYVEDTVDGLYKLMHSSVYTPVNIGNTNEITIIDFAKEVLELTNSKSEITFCSLPKDDPKVRCPDISKAQRELNWEPQISRREGVKRTLKSFQERI